MITGGITPRYVSSITTSNRAHGIQKGEILERLSSGKSGDKIKDSVFITESKSTILEGYLEDYIVAKMNKDVKRINEAIEIYNELGGYYEQLWDLGWKMFYDDNSKKFKITNDAKNPNKWVNYNREAPIIVKKINDLELSEWYFDVFRYRVMQGYGTTTNTMRFELRNFYSESITFAPIEWNNSDQNDLPLPIEDIKHIDPSHYGSILSKNDILNTANAIMELKGRPSHVVTNPKGDIQSFTKIRDKITKIRDAYEDKRKNILIMANDKKVFFSNKSIKMILEDKKTSNQRVEYYNSLMDT